MKRNNTTKQGKAYIGMYKKPVKQRKVYGKIENKCNIENQ